MYNSKKILFFILSLFSSSLIFCQNIPLAVFESQTVFDDIVKKIQKIMPSGVEIFLYPPYIVNATDSDKKLLETLIPETFYNSAKKLDFEIITMDILKKKNPEIAKIIIKNAGQDEIMWAAKNMQYDAILMINIGKTASDTRNVWSNKKKTFLKKEIYMLQANMFNPENSTVYSRFSSFFFLDN